MRLSANRTSARAGLTLIELMLVMTLLAVVITIAAPSLSGFFRGRVLDSEGRRLVALAHAGQSRAVSEGMPMVLWVDSEARTYGLKVDPGWSEQDTKAIEFNLGQDLKMEVVRTNLGVRAGSAVASGNAAKATSLRDNQSEIRFLPDGSIDENSPSALHLSDKDGVSLWLARSRNRMHYEIRNP